MSKLQDLEAKINVRADQIVQDKIKRFKTAIDKALSELFGKANTGIDKFGMYQYAETSSNDQSIALMKLEALKLAIRDHDQTQNNSKTLRPWPAALWETERLELREDLLAKMDLLQQLLMTNERTTEDDVPQQDTKPK